MTPPYTCGQLVRADGDVHCGLPARLYPAGWLCGPHAPANQPKRPAPTYTTAEKEPR
ncbi:hypothetical protein [Kitasatospora sp. A2-31]|uniref:hypothetical protein n=1 Tax=Kitasatospora sp. A2-31 TaxID=2916414 RepID=UPI001EEE556A|nr:hypothetical protein [Kitasatospora sp. A2-31]MCG6499429.1 hypothetical protein [Kitasatospora sp. A2-31]